jgi:CBS domain-containing protein
MITAKHIMSRRVVVVPENMGIRELANLLSDTMITGAPVVDEQGRLVGMVSSMDVVRYFGHEEKSIKSEIATIPAFDVREWDDEVDFQELRQFHVEDYEEPAWVSDIMTPVVFEVAEDAPLSEIAAMMVRGRIHRVVVTQDGRISGIVSSLDVLKAVAAGVE